MGERFKLELLDAIPEGEPVTLYHQGGWFDLCRGPHGPSTGKIGAFKLTKVAGAYWRGDARNPQLQRIYGTAFATKAGARRLPAPAGGGGAPRPSPLGREMDLFHVQEEARGLGLLAPARLDAVAGGGELRPPPARPRGYVEVKTPQLYDRVFWERSGHWEKFRENMFTLEAEERHLALKPMNCPGHVQIFNQSLHSYRDLPLRLAEFGSCHRNEPSGALHGIMRVRAFTQDDAHIFCTPEQITAESVAFCELLMQVYKDFGFTDVRVKFSDRPPVRAGADEVWDQAEAALWEAVRAAGLECTLNPGEGAFYGPKLEFVLRDAIGRDWQCGTLQVDFVLPERLDANYVGPDGAKHRPVMLHRAILGSLERFIGMLIEHYAGRLPVWLAPGAGGGRDDHQRGRWLRQRGGRAAQGGWRAGRGRHRARDKIGYKVREHSLRKVPLLLAVGGREQTERTVSLRRLGDTAQTDPVA